MEHAIQAEYECPRWHFSFINNNGFILCQLFLRVYMFVKRKKFCSSLQIRNYIIQYNFISELGNKFENKYICVRAVKGSFSCCLEELKV
jgi:hypothetical protein